MEGTTAEVRAAAVDERSLPGRVRSLLRIREYGILVAFVALFLVLTVTSDAFLTTTNLENILNQQAPVLIVAVAGTLVIIAGGFDLAVGAVYALAGVVAAEVALEVGAVAGILAGCAAGLAMGVANGVLVTAGRINSLIGTLATSFVFRGIALVATGGSLVIVESDSFTALGQNDVLGIKVAVWVALLFAATVWFVLTRTVFGRYVYASGDNAEAARLAGVRVEVVRAVTFAISGLAAGLAGVIAASRFGSGQADAGIGLEFTVIAGIVVGGTSILGGEGAVWRTIVGVLLIALIGNGFTLLEIEPTYQQIVQGLIILGAVALDAWTRRERA